MAMVSSTLPTTTDAMVAPLVDRDVDLGQLFPWFPIVRQRLFSSSFNAHATDTEWRAGMTLWIKSYDQRPTGSLPNDDAELWRLVELKGNMRTWRKIKAMALHGWVLCDDDRLYHPLIAEIVNSTKNRESLVKHMAKLNENIGGNATRARKENNTPPKSPPRNGGDFLAWNGVKPAGDDSAWPQWLEDIYGPAPEGPLKRAAELKRINEGR